MDRMKIINNEARKAVVLLSGGLDSATTLAVAIDKGFSCYALTIDYGQRHRVELDAAGCVAKSFGRVQHRILSLDLNLFAESALTGGSDVPKDRLSEDLTDEIPATYVPARNTIMLSLALAWAETIDANHIFIGANAVDYSGYPDCRPEFISAFQRLANLATKRGIEGDAFNIVAPLMDLSKEEIIRLGTDLGIDYGMTHSCYDPSPEGLACGHCDSCIIRRRGFEKANIPDPTRYMEE